MSHFRQISRRTRLATVVAVGIAVAGLATASRASAIPATPMPHFLLAAATDEMPRGELAMIVRTAGGAQPDLIILSPAASPHHTLPAAVTLLRQLRLEAPVTTATEVHSVTVAFAHRALPMASNARYAAALARARAGVPRDIGGVGRANVAVARFDDFR